MSDENFTGVRATTADEEAVMFQQSWFRAEREITRLRGQVEALNAERDRLWVEKLKTQGEIKRLRSELTDYKDAAASEADRVNELTAENEILREENARLWEENRQMRAMWDEALLRAIPVQAAIRETRK